MLKQVRYLIREASKLQVDPKAEKLLDEVS